MALRSYKASSVAPSIVSPTVAPESPAGLKLNHAEGPTEEEWEPLPVAFTSLSMTEDGLVSGIAKWEPNHASARFLLLEDGKNFRFGRDGYLGGQLVTADATVTMEDGIVWVKYD